ncbi:MAG: hypothetical protein KBS59_03110 [Clostridiales bacterium]|nr:hypothetical protein [Clostridiales bacterium]
MTKLRIKEKSNGEMRGKKVTATYGIYNKKAYKCEGMDSIRFSIGLRRENTRTPPSRDDNSTLRAKKRFVKME